MFFIIIIFHLVVKTITLESTISHYYYTSIKENIVFSLTITLLQPG